jgi:hypothetical protein
MISIKFVLHKFCTCTRLLFGVTKWTNIQINHDQKLSGEAWRRRYYKWVFGLLKLVSLENISRVNITKNTKLPCKFPTQRCTGVTLTFGWRGLGFDSIFSLNWRCHHCRWRTVLKLMLWNCDHRRVLYCATPVASVFNVSSEGPPHLFAFLRQTRGVLTRILSSLDSHGIRDLVFFSVQNICFAQFAVLCAIALAVSKIL